MTSRSSRARRLRPRRRSERVSGRPPRSSVRSRRLCSANGSAPCGCGPTENAMANADLSVIPSARPTIFFDGHVSAIEALFGEAKSPEIAVLLEDRFQDLRMTRRTRTFTDSSDADVIRGIVGDHGLEADVDVSGPRHKVVAQVNQSDLAF